MKLRHQRVTSREASSTVTADAVDDAPSADIDDGAAPGHGPHHDPSVQAERESFTVTTQRCRGEYP